MTRQRDFKARVRARMEHTGERYSAARAQVLAAGQKQHTAPASFSIRPFSSVHAVGGQQAAAQRQLSLCTDDTHSCAL